jgi:cephalosporin-C deacetylase-like acetyl esterase/pimeloyl-ACP methyl ester carboxylesterase
VQQKGEGKKEDTTFELWLPGDIGYAKGIVVISKHGAGRNLFVHPELRRMARELHLALFTFEGNPMQRGFWPRSLLYERLAVFAQKTGHPELAHAPFFLFGHSNGTGFSAIFPATESARVWAWVSMRPGTVFQVYQPSAAQIPGLVIFGEDDQFFARPSKVESLAVVQAMRKNCGALWNCVVEPKSGHAPGENTWPLVFSFLRHTFTSRVPADADPRQAPVKLIALREEVACLGQNWDPVQGGYQNLPVAPVASFSGNKTVASWLINAAYTADWQKFQAEGRLATPEKLLPLETFETCTPGTLPDGWEVSPQGLLAATVTDNPAGGKALSLVKPEVTKDSPILSSPRAASAQDHGIVCVKASVMAMQDDAIGTLLIQAPGGTNNVFMNLGRGSPILISENGGVTRLAGEFKPKQWIDFLFRLNLDTQKYDAFVNGKLAASDVGYGATRPGHNLQIQFSFNRVSKGTFFLDNLEMVAGDIAPPAPPPGTFPGQKSDFRGFDRYSFPLANGNVSVICPKTPAPGKPWLWRGSFWGEKVNPATELTVLADLKLLDKGFHVVIAGPGIPLGHPDGAKRMDAVYAEMTGKYGFAKKPALMGLSREALSVYRWASANPDKVACIYIDNGVCDLKSWPGGKRVIGNTSLADGEPAQWQLMLKTYQFKSDADALAYQGNPVDILEPLAKAKVPLLHVCGDSDTTVPYAENSAVVKDRYEQMGGKIVVILKKGASHHPHGLEDPTPIIEFICSHAGASRAAAEQRKLQVIQPNTFIQTVTDRPDAIYKAGEKAVFRLSLTDKTAPAAIPPLKWALTYDGVRDIASGQVTLVDGRATVEGTLSEPGTLRLEVTPATDADMLGTALAAAVFDPYQIEPTAKLPADFKDFWNAQKAELAQVPMDARTEPVAQDNPGVEVFEISLANIKGLRIRGYLAKPKGATALPALISLPGMGNHPGTIKRAADTAALGFLALDIGIHDFPTTFPSVTSPELDEKWKQLMGYPWMGREDRTTYYYRQVILGIVRAIDFIDSRPDWNRKVLITSGGSQGGGLAIIAAGVDSRVTAVAAVCPALAEYTGPLMGRPDSAPRRLIFEPRVGQGSKPDPKIIEATAYYDAVNFARFVKVPAIMSIGFIDTGVPPTVAFSVYNTLTGPKAVALDPLMGHNQAKSYAELRRKFFQEQTGLKDLSGKSIPNGNIGAPISK